jgi:hypothetical protein
MYPAAKDSGLIAQTLLSNARSDGGNSNNTGALSEVSTQSESTQDRPTFSRSDLGAVT